MNWYDDVNIVAQIHWLWVVTFTSWLWLFVWIDHTNSVFLSSIHLLPPLVVLIQRKPQFYLQLRCVCIALFLFVRCPVAIFDTFPWFINADNFPFWQNVADNHTYVFTIIGAINLTASLIHSVIFIKDIYERRKDEKTKLKEQVKMGDVNVGPIA
eukprot:UN01104